MPKVDWTTSWAYSETNEKSRKSLNMLSKNMNELLQGSEWTDLKPLTFIFPFCLLSMHYSEMYEIKNYSFGPTPLVPNLESPSAN